MEDKDVFEGIKWVMKNGYVKGKTFGGSYDITKQTGYLYFLREVPGSDKVPQMVITEIKWVGSDPKQYKLTNTPLSEDEVKALKNEYKKSKKMKEGGNITTYKVGKHGKEQRMLLKQLLDSLNTNITKEETAEGIIGFNANGIPIYVKQNPVYLTKRVFSSAGDKGPNYTLIEEESPEGIRYIFKEGDTKKIFTDVKEFPYGKLPFLQDGTGVGGVQQQSPTVGAPKVPNANNVNQVTGTMNTSNTGTIASQTPNNNLVTNNSVTNKQSDSQLNTQNATQRRLQMLQQDEINNAKRLNLSQFNASTPDISDYSNSIQKKQDLHGQVRQINANRDAAHSEAWGALGNKVSEKVSGKIAGMIINGINSRTGSVNSGEGTVSTTPPTTTSSKGSKISYKTLF